MAGRAGPKWKDGQRPCKEKNIRSKSLWQLNTYDNSLHLEDCFQTLILEGKWKQIFKSPSLRKEYAIGILNSFKPPGKELPLHTIFTCFFLYRKCLKILSLLCKIILSFSSCLKPKCPTQDLSISNSPTYSLNLSPRRLCPKPPATPVSKTSHCSLLQEKCLPPTRPQTLSPCLPRPRIEEEKKVGPDPQSSCRHLDAFHGEEKRTLAREILSLEKFLQQK